MDWADKLVTRAKDRGEKLSAEALRQWVERQCNSNLERWDEIPAEERNAAAKEETARLIKLKEDEDARKQLQFDFAQRGIFIEPDHSQLGKIAEVELNFSSEEWADLLNREGELLPSCCADISRIRDILQDACRNNYYISVENLFEAAYLAKHHGFLPDEDHPVCKIMALWETVKDHARQRSLVGTANLDNPRDALDALYDAAGVISWAETFSGNRHQEENMQFEDKMNRNAALATIQTAVRTLFFKLKEMDEGPIEGYGIAHNNEIAHTRRGLAIFKTHEIAQEICDNWNSSEGETNRKQGPRVYSVKKVRVSMEKGLEFIE